LHNLTQSPEKEFPVLRPGANETFAIHSSSFGPSQLLRVKLGNRSEKVIPSENRNTWEFVASHRSLCGRSFSIEVPAVNPQMCLACQQDLGLGITHTTKVMCVSLHFMWVYLKRLWRFVQSPKNLLI